VLDDFQDLGRDMFVTGLVSSHTGSLSARQDGKMVITRRGAMLGRLKEGDLLEVEIEGDCPEEAAEDAVIHQAVYRATDAQAVVYALPPYTSALALVEDRLTPASRDGADNLGSAPVLISQRNIDSPDVAQLIGRTLRESRVAALRGSGVFARGADIFDAFHMVSLLEEMCKVAQIYRTLTAGEAQPAGFEQRQPTSTYRPRNDYGRRPPTGRPQQPRGGPSGPPRHNDGQPPRRPYQPRDPNGARRGPPPRH
jgi:L-fuculose-phosphate aldolase